MGIEIIAIILSSVAIVVSIIFGIVSFLNYRHDDGINEINFRAEINRSLEFYINSSTNFLNYTGSSEEDKQILAAFNEAAIEAYLNVYDDLCSIYLEKKLSRNSFSKRFRNELKSLVDNETFNEYFFPEIKSNYKSILKLYNDDNFKCKFKKK